MTQGPGVVESAHRLHLEREAKAREAAERAADTVVVETLPDPDVAPVPEAPKGKKGK